MEKLQKYIDMTFDEQMDCCRRSWNALDEYRASKILPYGAVSKKQIPVKQELRKARNWKPGF